MVAQEHCDAYQSLSASPELPSLLLLRGALASSRVSERSASPEGSEDLPTTGCKLFVEAGEGGDEKSSSSAHHGGEDPADGGEGAAKGDIQAQKGEESETSRQEPQGAANAQDVSMVCDRCGRADFKNLQVRLPRCVSTFYQPCCASNASQLLVLRASELHIHCARRNSIAQA